jgi:hypothetical protein
MAKPTANRKLQEVIVLRDGDRLAELGRLLKGKVQTNWKQAGDSFEISRVLLDEAYRQPFDDLMALMRHNESVLASVIHQKALRRTDVRR